ncbi:hypothetical protein LOTGIDRAFT_62468, partial [Lottia gigantea]
QKCDGFVQPEYKKFSIDPQITSFEMLQGILARAFDIKGEFMISYLAKDTEDQDVYLAMLSDWDMDAAIQCAADPCLRLKVDLKPFEEGLDDWDVIAPTDIPQHKVSTIADKGSILYSITGTISSQIGRSVTSMQRAMGFRGDDDFKPCKPPMSDSEFHNYLDSVGFLLKPQEFRLGIYQGGIEASLRRVAWRHLCNIYPANMTGRERFDYMKRKEKEYYHLREEWKARFSSDTATEEVKYVASMVKKDVLRTDRGHKFFAGSDDNENVVMLFHILVTYALTHPDVSYCQGMSDIASPILVTQKDEAQAYLCFCGIMKRLKLNFMPDGAAIMLKFKHLGLLLQINDPEFYAYLQQICAHDLFFCYRWLLLELKREFPFEDALYMIEVMWSTLPPDPPETELELTDSDYNVHLLSTSPCSPTFSFQQTVYAKLLAMRRLGSAQKLVEDTKFNGHNEEYDASTLTECSITVSEPSIKDELKERDEGLLELEPESDQHTQFHMSLEASGEATPPVAEQSTPKSDSGGFFGNMKRMLSSPKPIETPVSNSQSVNLPSPEEFGCGNPFLMFLCLALMLQHRDYIMSNNMDYEEVAMHFDKMVRRHNVHKVLFMARQLYTEYLRTQ